MILHWLQVAAEGVAAFLVPIAALGLAAVLMYLGLNRWG